MNLKLERPREADIPELLNLFRLVYGRTYPLSVGTDAAVMEAALRKDTNIWFIARDSASGGKIAASTMAEVDAENKIGRITGMVVHPEYRRHNLATQMVAAIVDETIGPRGNLNSVYATTRTLGVGAQAVFLKNGFLPLGILPNAHRLHDYETLTLMARFRDGILEMRQAPVVIPEKLQPIVQILEGLTGREARFPSAPPTKFSNKEMFEFEFILAPDFVRNRFRKVFSDPYDRFYPFHEPNLLIAGKNQGPELYAYFSKADGYCTLVCGTAPLALVNASLDSLIHDLGNYGVSYLETMIALEHFDAISVMLEHQFLPSALYPAMRVLDGKPQDFVLLSRTSEPLNFRGMAIDRRFKPYLDQFVLQWKQAYFDGIEVVGEQL